MKWLRKPAKIEDSSLQDNEKESSLYNQFPQRCRIWLENLTPGEEQVL